MVGLRAAIIRLVVKVGVLYNQAVHGATMPGMQSENVGGPCLLVVALVTAPPSLRDAPIEFFVALRENH